MLCSHLQRDARFEVRRASDGWEGCAACRFDSLDSSNALDRKEDAVESEVEAETAFTRVPYEKGASVLRMLHAHMLRSSPDSGGDADTKPWQLRRSRKLQNSAGSFRGSSRELLDSSSSAALVPGALHCRLYML
jgi:hypothetical protein